MILHIYGEDAQDIVQKMDSIQRKVIEGYISGEDWDLEEE